MNNEIHLPVAELKQALPGLNKIISKGTTLPALQHLRIQRDPDGGILIHATNLDDFGSIRLVERQPGNPVDILVPFETLARFTKASSPKDNLRLLPSAGEAVLVYPLGNTFAEQKLQTLPPEEWPAIPTLDQPTITLDDNFKAALQTALDCASEDETKKVLNGACLDVSEKNSHYVIATEREVGDTHRQGIPDLAWKRLRSRDSHAVFETANRVTQRRGGLFIGQTRCSRDRPN